MDIRVVNKRTHAADRIRDVYIGRPSPLGNPFSSKNYGLGQKVGNVEESIALFKDHLNERISMKDRAICNELDRIYALALEGPVNLVCWCKNKDGSNPCHGDVIKEVIENAHKLRDGL